MAKYTVIKRSKAAPAYCPFHDGDCNPNCVFLSTHAYINNDDPGTYVCLLVKDYQRFIPSYLSVVEED